jgi:antitoxin VapB
MNAHDKIGQSGELARRTARLFRNGRSQAVRIPKEWEFEGDEVLLERAKDGSLRLRPVRSAPSLTAVLASLKPLPKDDWMPDLTNDDLLPLDDVEL